LATKRALQRSILPFEFLLVLKTHLQSTTLLAWDAGTKLHVLFCVKASNSFAIAHRQCGSLDAWVKEVGSRSWILIGWFVASIAFGVETDRRLLARVIIWWGEVGGDLDSCGKGEGKTVNGYDLLRLEYTCVIGGLGGRDREVLRVWQWGEGVEGSDMEVELSSEEDIGEKLLKESNWRG
jgi:hypothetical protein